MANKQTLPSVLNGGVRGRTGVSAHLLPMSERKIVYNPMVERVGSVLDVADKLNKERMRVEKENEGLVVQADVKKYQEALRNASTPLMVDEISKTAESELGYRGNNAKNNIVAEEFWKKHGEKVLDANRLDMEKIKQLKEGEFGKNSLIEMLANAQNVLAMSRGEHGVELLSYGVDEINKTPFLNIDEKNMYRESYLKNGIMNLALNDPMSAKNAVEKYLPQIKDDLWTKIEEIEELNNSFVERKQLENKRQNEINEFANMQRAWQMFEKGMVNPAEFFVLTGGKADEILWGMGENVSSKSLAEAYRLVKRMNGGEVLSAKDVNDAGNYLIGAYKQKKIGFDLVADLQNRFASGGMAVAGSGVDELIDGVFGADASILIKTAGALEYMENKAKMAFSVYDACRRREIELFGEAQKNGVEFTEELGEKIAHQAIIDVKDSFGLVEDVNGGVSYALLRDELKKVYSGTDEGEIWKKFFEMAGKSDDKVKLLQNIGKQQQKKELNYPQFNSYEEIKRAGLEPGDRFYFKGRMAVLKG